MSGERKNFSKKKSHLRNKTPSSQQLVLQARSGIVFHSLLPQKKKRKQELLLGFCQIRWARITKWLDLPWVVSVFSAIVEEVFFDIFNTCCSDGLLFQYRKSTSGYYLSSGVLCLNTTSYRAREWFPTQTIVILDVWGITAQFRNWIDWHVWEFLFTRFILVPACRNEAANGGWWPAAMDIRSHQLQWLHCSCAAQGRQTGNMGP